MLPPDVRDPTPSSLRSRAATSSGSRSNATPAISTSSPGSNPWPRARRSPRSRAACARGTRARPRCRGRTARPAARSPSADAEAALARPARPASSRSAAGRNTRCSASSPARSALAAVGQPRAAVALDRGRAASSSRGQLAEPGAGDRRRSRSPGTSGTEPLGPDARAPPRACRSSTRSAFDSASTRGSTASRGSCSSSSRSTSSWLATGSDPSSGASSSTWTSSRVRSMCARNSWPSPAPAEAPSISPGMSAITSCRSSVSSVPEHRLERRERIVGDLRMRARQPRQQRRLAGVGKPDQPDVGEQLQLERDPGLLAREPALGEPRRLVRRAREALVAPAARTAPRHDRTLTGTHQVVARAVGLDQRLGSRRDRELERLAVLAVAQRALRRDRPRPRLEVRSCAGTSRGRAASRRTRARRRRRDRRRRRSGRPWARAPRGGS